MSYGAQLNQYEEKMQGQIFLAGILVGLLAAMCNIIVAIGWWAGISVPSTGMAFIWFILNTGAIVCLLIGGGRLWWLRRERIRRGGPTYFMPNL